MASLAGASTKVIDTINELIKAGKKVPDALREEADKLGFRGTVIRVDEHNSGKKIPTEQAAAKVEKEVPVPKVEDEKTTGVDEEKVAYWKKLIPKSTKKNPGAAAEAYNKNSSANELRTGELTFVGETTPPKTESEKLANLKKQVSAATETPDKKPKNAALDAIVSDINKRDFGETTPPKTQSTTTEVSKAEAAPKAASATANLDAKIEDIQDKLADNPNDKSLLKQLKEAQAQRTKASTTAPQAAATPASAPAATPVPKKVKELTSKAGSPTDSVELENGRKLTRAEFTGMGGTSEEFDKMVQGRRSYGQVQMDDAYNVKNIKEADAKIAEVDKQIAERSAKAERLSKKKPQFRQEEANLKREKAQNDTELAKLKEQKSNLSAQKEEVASKTSPEALSKLQQTAKQNSDFVGPPKAGEEATSSPLPPGPVYKETLVKGAAGNFKRADTDYATFNKQTGFETKLNEGLYNVKFVKESGEALPPEQVVELKKGILAAQKEGSAGIAKYAKGLAAGGILLGVGSQFLKPTEEAVQKVEPQKVTPPTPAPTEPTAPAVPSAPKVPTTPGKPSEPAKVTTKQAGIKVDKPEDLNTFWTNIQKAVEPMAQLDQATQERFKGQEDSLTAAIKDATASYNESIKTAKDEAERREAIASWGQIFETLGQAAIKYFAAREGKRLGQRIGSNLQLEKHDWSSDLNRSMKKLEVDMAQAKEKFGIAREEVEAGRKALSKEREGLQERAYKRADMFLKASLDERERAQTEAARAKMNAEERAFKQQQNAAEMANALKLKQMELDARVTAAKTKASTGDKKKIETVEQSYSKSGLLFDNWYDAKSKNKELRQKEFANASAGLSLTPEETAELARLSEGPGFFSSKENKAAARGILQEAYNRKLKSYAGGEEVEAEAETPGQPAPPAGTIKVEFEGLEGDYKYLTPEQLAAAKAKYGNKVKVSK